MVSGFFGRLAAYDLALDITDESARFEDLKKVIVRNIYRNTAMSDDSVNAMAHYLLKQTAALEQQQTSTLMNGSVEFSKPDYENRDRP